MASRILSLFNCAGGGGSCTGGRDAKRRRQKRQLEQLERKRRSGGASDEERPSSLEQAYRPVGRDEAESGRPQHEWEAEISQAVQIRWRTFNYLGEKETHTDGGHDQDAGLHQHRREPSYSLVQVHFTDARPLRVRGHCRSGAAAWAGPPEPAIWCAFARHHCLEARLVSLRPNSGGLQPGSCQPALVVPAPECGSFGHCGGVEADDDHNCGGCNWRCNLESDGSALLLQHDRRLYHAQLSRLQPQFAPIMHDCAAFCCSERMLFALNCSDGILGCAPIRWLAGRTDTEQEAEAEAEAEAALVTWKHRWRLPCGEIDCDWHSLAHWPAGCRLFVASRTRVLALDVPGLWDGGHEAPKDDYDEVDDGSENEVDVENASLVFRLPLAAALRICGGGGGGGPTEFHHVTDLAVDPRGLLFVCDQRASRVHAYDAGSGRHLAAIGGREFQPDVLLLNYLLPGEGLEDFSQPGVLHQPATLCVFQRGQDRLLLVSGGFGCACQTFDISCICTVGSSCHA